MTEVRAIVQDPRCFIREGVSEALRSSGVMVVAAVPTVAALDHALGELDADVVLSPVAGSAITRLTARHRLVRITDGTTIAAMISAAIRGPSGSKPPRSATHAEPLRALLTAREAGVLELVAVGLTAREIAQRLGISARTVDGHKQAVFTKFGVASQAQAVARALDEGLILLLPGDPTAEPIP
ncbi:helix-turn-helix transcriptional regulator [Blastococcus saxobsidens]|uniref:helix-turn-helix transcriptional regulator n=1 Tax=Blastococcus saxobsidens TaxID=138336 RepID=UPI000306D7C1|nr:helix-turn-helix transcriptional regulator [Blastococcus saxobsidens]